MLPFLLPDVILRLLKYLYVYVLVMVSGEMDFWNFNIYLVFSYEYQLWVVNKAEHGEYQKHRADV